MPTPQHDADDTQPQRNAPETNHRVYIPATWAAAGHGAGHPKLSGGITVDRRKGTPAPRGFNRPDSRYNQPSTTIQANRTARANAEYATTVILLGAEGRYEVRSDSGNNYDISPNLSICDCPDWLRIDESGYGLVRCKHIKLVMLRLADPMWPNGPDWSTAKLAEYLGISERTAEELCQDGFFSATKQHNVWIIPSLTNDNMLKTYLAKILFTPRDWTTTITVSRDAAVYDAGLQQWSQTVHFTNPASFDFVERVRAVVSNVSTDSTPFGEDQFTDVFPPLDSPYFTVANPGLASGATADYTFKFHNPTGSALTYDLSLVVGRGLI